MLLDNINNLLEMNFSISIVFVVINIFISFCLGLLISATYRKTHKGLSYSQSFVLTIIYITTITSSVIMVIGNNLARAFALVGALSIIRFRTVVKDTKDITFIFLSLCIGLAVGTNNYFIAIFTTVFMCLAMWILFKMNFGVLQAREFILRFYFLRDGNEEDYLDVLKSNTKYLNLLHMEPTVDSKRIHLTYDVSLKEGINAKQLIDKINRLKDIEEVILVSSKSDIDY